MKVITAPNGRKMVYYDGVNDPPGWWKDVKIPRPVDRWRWVKVVGWGLAIAFGVAFFAWILVPALVLKAVVAIASKPTRRRSRWA